MTTPNAWLSVKWGQGAGQIYPLAEESVVGRDPACAIVISGSGAAPQQLLIQWKESGYWLAPLAESPPTYVNGAELQATYRLMPGDEIAIPPEVIYVFQRAATGGDQAHLEEASFLLEQGDWQQALSEYEEALRLNPLLLTAYHKRALIFQIVGDLDHCLAECDRGLSINQTDAQLLFLRGKAHQGKGETEAALADYTEAIQADASFVPAYEARAAAYLERSELTQARNDCEQAIKLKPKSDVAYNLRGLINHQQGQYQAAIRDFDRAIQLSRRDATLYYNRAIAYAKYGQYNKAIKDLETIVSSGSNADLVQDAGQLINQLKLAQAASKVSSIKLMRVTGMLIAYRVERVEGTLPRGTLIQEAYNVMLFNLALGWWSPRAAIMTIASIFYNLWHILSVNDNEVRLKAGLPLLLLHTPIFYLLILVLWKIAG